MAYEAAARRADDGAAWPLPADLRLAPVDPVIAEGVERLLDLAFGYDRHGRTAYRLRDRVAAWPDASFVALDEAAALVGSIQTWPLALAPADGGPITPLWLVGPIAVHPAARNRGIGRGMLARVLERIDASPYPAMLIGDPDYYAPFGFASARTAGWSLPGPVERHRLLLRASLDAPLPHAGTLAPRHGTFVGQTSVSGL